MGYRRMKKRDLWEIYRRWQAGQSLSHIAANERRDRKTVRYYLQGFGNLGLAPSGTSMDDQQFYQVVQNLLPTRNERPAPGSEQLLPHVDELRELINRSKEALKPKTAFLVVRTKYELSVSYATFKRFARQQGLSRVERKRMIRIELPPGLETQLDYGKVGNAAGWGPWGRSYRVGVLRGADPQSASLRAVRLQPGQGEFRGQRGADAGVLRWVHAVHLPGQSEVSRHQARSLGSSDQPGAGRGGRTLRGLRRPLPCGTEYRQGKGRAIRSCGTGTVRDAQGPGSQRGPWRAQPPCPAVVPRRLRAQGARNHRRGSDGGLRGGAPHAEGAARRALSSSRVETGQRACAGTSFSPSTRGASPFRQPGGGCGYGPDTPPRCCSFSTTKSTLSASTCSTIINGSTGWQRTSPWRCER